MLENGPAVIRITAAQALGNIGPAAAAVPVLKTLLTDPDILLRKRAAEALNQIECRSTTVGQLVAQATQAATRQIEGETTPGGGANWKPRKTLSLKASQIAGKPRAEIRDLEGKWFREPSAYYEFTWDDESIEMTGSDPHGLRACRRKQLKDSPEERATFADYLEWLESREAVEN